jgi:hypothetical protein
MRTRTLIIASVISTAVAGFVSGQETPQGVAAGPWRTGVAVHCPDGRTIPANTIISGPNVTAEELCGSNSTSGNSSNSGALISNTGNTAQDLVTNSVNLFIVSHTTNPFVSGFMQGAATSFISSMFANNAEAQRQQQLMAQEILRRKQEQERQRRIAEQQRFDAMYARLSGALKLEGLPFDLGLKPMNTGADLELKSMNTSGPDALKLKMGNGGGKGIPGLPGTYVGGPAGTQTATNDATPDNSGKGYGIQGLPGIYVGGPAGAQTTGTAAPSNSGIPGLPGIYLNGVQPSQAPQLAQAAQDLSGPERALAQDTALHAAQQNPALTAPAQDPRTEDFQHANQEYQQALQASTRANQDYQIAQGHVEADKSALDVARAKLSQVTPTPEQQQAFNQMLAAAKTDEDDAAAARKIFENTDTQLSLSRTKAAGALAQLSPPAGAATVDLSSAKSAPALMRTSTPVGHPISTSSSAAAAPPQPAPPVPALKLSSSSVLATADPLATCVASVAHASNAAATTPTLEQLHSQLEVSQEALRRLIETHEKEDALREQWEDETKDAIHDAKKQAFDLSVDYVLRKAQAITRAKIWKSDAEAEELQKLLAGSGDSTKLASLRSQIEQAAARKQSLQHTLQSLKDLKDGVEEQERLRDLREWGSKDPKQLQEASGYLEGIKQLVQAALAENAVKDTLQFTPYANDAIKWGSSLIDTSYDLTAEFMSARRLDQLNRNSDQYLQAVKALNGRIQVTVAQMNCYKTDTSHAVARNQDAN